MEFKKILGILLTGTMVLGALGGCGGENADANAGGQTKASSEAKETAGSTETVGEDGSAGESSIAGEGTSAGEAGTVAAAVEVDWEDVEDIEVLMMEPAGGVTSAMVERLNGAINEITEEEIRVHVNMNFVSMGAYAQQVSLLMSSGDPMDVMLTMPMAAASFNVMAANNQLTDITELLEDYGQPILDTVGDLIKGTTVNGNIYGVPVYRNLGSELSIYMRKDILENLDLVETAQGISSWDEMIALFDTVLSHEEYSDMVALAPGPAKSFISNNGSYNAVDSFDQSITYDSLGEQTKLIAVVDESDQVVLNYEQPGYKDMIKKMEQWDADGYIYKDSLVTESGADLMKNGVAFATIIDTEFGSETTAMPTYGYEVVKVPVVRYPISTGSVTKFTWVVPMTSKNPEAAVAFMSMMYADSRINNIMAWGVEGVDYEVVDGIARFVEGSDIEPYHGADFMVGNQFLVTPWEGQPENYRELQKADMDATPLSKYLGFTMDTSGITNEISATSVVVNEYQPTIDCGFGDDALYEEFIQKLYDNGAQKIIDAYQEQLDTWLANQ